MAGTGQNCSLIHFGVILGNLYPSVQKKSGQMERVNFFSDPGLVGKIALFYKGESIKVS